MRSHATHSKRQRRSLDRGRAVWRTRHSDPGAALRRRLEQQRSELERENATLRRSEQTLLRRLDFEEFLFDLSRTFIGLTEEEVDVNMERGLRRVGEFLEMDRVTLLELSRDRTEMTVAYVWSVHREAMPPAVITKSAQPWWVGQVLHGEAALASRVDDLPEEAAAEKEYLRQRGVASAASIPLRVSGEIAGAISFVTLHRHVAWTEELTNELRAIGDILWNALKRRRSMQALIKAQGFLSDSEERFRLAMNNVAAGVYTLNLNGMVTYINPAAEAILGWTNAELLDKKMHDVTHYKHPDGTPYPARECPGLNVLQEGIELREHQDMFIRKDGSFVPVVFSASPLKKDRMTVGIVVGFRDDTPRREAERAVRESEERFRVMANAAPVLIWMSGVDKLCTYFNQGWLDFTGRPLEAEPGNGWLEGVHADDVEKCLDTYTKAFDRREPFQMEYRLRRHDGEYRWIYDQGVPRFNADSSFAGYIGTCIDVTESKLSAQALSTMNQRLIEAHEEERARLARELHDDIVRRLALLSVNLQLVKRTPLPADADRDLAVPFPCVAGSLAECDQA
jgi:PAS domain S-box-containing protein